MKIFKIDCYPVDKNVKMKDLGIVVSNAKEVIEFDDIAIVGDCGIIFETTTQNKGNKEKIKQFFYSKFSAFIKAHEDGTLNLKAFPTLSNNAISKFRKIKHWKCVYLSTAYELIESNLDERSFPNSQDLAIFHSEHLSYIEFLANRLGKYGRNEFLRRLDIVEEDPEQPLYPIKVNSLKLENKKISGNVNADVFMFQIPALDLLNLSLVPRYGSLDDWAPKYGDENYQRLLAKDKIKKIAELIDRGKGESSFPNAITVILSDEIEVKKVSGVLTQLTIPNSYGVIEVIDGQHRLFGYAFSKLPKSKLKQSKLMVIGLLFREKSGAKRRKIAARIFVEINREQTRVPNDLIYLISNPVMGEVTTKSLSARVLAILNNETYGPLQNVFYTRPFQNVNPAGGKPVKIVMSADELSKLFNPENKNQASTKHLYDLFPNSILDNLRKNEKQILNTGVEVVKKYFQILKSNFDDDWKSDKSYIFSSKYMMAMIRLFIEYKRKGYGDNIVGKKISEFKKRVIKYLIRKEGSKKVKAKKIVFYNKYKSLPAIEDYQEDIAKFILKYGL